MPSRASGRIDMKSQFIRLYLGGMITKHNGMIHSGLDLVQKPITKVNGREEIVQIIRGHRVHWIHRIGCVHWIEDIVRPVWRPAKPTDQGLGISEGEPVGALEPVLIWTEYLVLNHEECGSIWSASELSCDLVQFVQRLLVVHSTFMHPLFSFLIVAYTLDGRLTWRWICGGDRLHGYPGNEVKE
jgi:hypothetical protein